MIVTARKPLTEILATLAPYRRVLILGCGGCVTVSQSGGAKEAEELRAELELALNRSGEAPKEFRVLAPARQCDPEFFAEPALVEAAAASEAVLSLACGAGVQLASEALTGKVGAALDAESRARARQSVLPGANTMFLAASPEAGLWLEYCAGCGACCLAETGGVCPVARCSKGLAHGPCGGTFPDGSCEVDRGQPCAWKLIHERLGSALVERALAASAVVLVPPRDWRRAGGGAPRRIVREDLRPLDAGQAAGAGGKA